MSTVERMTLPLNRGRAWTAAEIKSLRDWWGRTHSAGVIAKRLGRPRNSVIGKLNRLGLLRKSVKGGFRYGHSV